MNNLILISSTPKKSNTPNLKKQKHPTTQVMVDEALRVINTKKCSYKAIKNYISTTYDVNMKFLTYYIKSYIKSCLENGKFKQMTGQGLNGSFRLSAEAKKNPEKFIIRRPPRKPLQRWGTALAAIKAFKPKNKPTTFLMSSFQRRCSITKPTIVHRQRRSVGRTPRPRLAKIGIQYSTELDESQSDNSNSGSEYECEDENNNLPSTSADSLINMTFNKKLDYLKRWF